MLALVGGFSLEITGVALAVTRLGPRRLWPLWQRASAGGAVLGATGILVAIAWGSRWASLPTIDLLVFVLVPPVYATCVTWGLLGRRTRNEGRVGRNAIRIVDVLLTGVMGLAVYDWTMQGVHQHVSGQTATVILRAAGVCAAASIVLEAGTFGTGASSWVLGGLLGGVCLGGELAGLALGLGAQSVFMVLALGGVALLAWGRTGSDPRVRDTGPDPLEQVPS